MAHAAFTLAARKKRHCPGFYPEAPHGEPRPPDGGRAGADSPLACCCRRELGGQRPRLQPSEPQGLRREEEASSGGEDGERSVDSRKNKQQNE